MSKKEIFILIFGILLLPSICSANVVLPMLFLTFPMMMPALIFVVWAEALVVANYFKNKENGSSYAFINYFWAVLIANIVSTIVGLPLASFVAMFTPFGLIREGIQLWMIITGFFLNLLLSFFASIWIEYVVLKKVLKNELKKDIGKAALKANLVSYTVLFGFVFLVILLSSFNEQLNFFKNPFTFEYLLLFSVLFLPIIIFYTFFVKKTGWVLNLLKYGILILIELLLIQHFWVPNIFYPNELYGNLYNFFNHQEGAMCNRNEPCAEGYGCLSGRCVDLSEQQKNVRCDFDSQCAEGYRCVNDLGNNYSECVKLEEQRERSFCVFSRDCASGYVCHSGKCISEKTHFCSSDNDCWQDYVCSEDNICVKALRLPLK